MEFTKMLIKMEAAKYAGILDYVTPLGDTFNLAVERLGKLAGAKIVAIIDESAAIEDVNEDPIYKIDASIKEVEKIKTIR